jgi:hypothetical protein
MAGGCLGLVVVTAVMLQNPSRDALRAGLDTLYSGEFARAASYFETLARRDTTDPAPLVFQAGAYIWWASALDSAGYELPRIDSLLTLAMTRAHARPSAAMDFWLATALGYRARQREENGHGFSAAKDAKQMRDIYGRLLAADSTCFDCYLGLGVYDYGLARASAISRLFARVVGLGSGDAERGIRYMRRAAHDGDLSRIESTWVLAAALMREAERDQAGRAVLEREARGYVVTLAARYPDNPVFQRFLKETAPPGTPSAGEAVRPATRAAPAAIPLPPVGWRERRKLAEHVVHVTLHGVRGDVQPLGDFLVSEPGGNEVPNLLLPFREAHVGDSRRARYGCAVPTFRTARWSGWRREIGSARDGANGFHNVLRRRVLHDEAVGAALDELLDVLLRRHEVDDNRFGVGRGRFEITEERVTVAVRQRRIEQHDLRLGVAHRGGSGVGVLGTRNDLHVGERSEQTGQSVAHQAIVFDNENTNTGSRRGTRSYAPLSTTAIHAVAFHHPIINSATAWWRDATLDAANGPRHTPPPFWDAMYSPPIGDGSNREVESSSAKSLF